MPDMHALIRTLSDAVRTQLAGYDVGTVLDRLGQDVTSILGIAGAGVSLSGADGDLRIVTATSETVMRIEMWQEEHQEGPSQDAYRSGKSISCADLSDEQRWEGYPSVARELGLRSVAGLPIASHGHLIGALDLYHTEPRDWPEPDLEVAQLLADVAALDVIGDRELGGARALAEQLQKALDSRIVIEQAKGVIAERKGIDLGSAFGRLRSHARSSRITVHEVARAVVAGDLDL